MKNLFINMIILVVIFSCNSKINLLEDTISIKLSEEHLFINADSLFNEDIFIRLETIETSIIGEISKLIIYNQDLYIYDRTQKTIFLFSENGKYKNKIHHIGRAPEEYIGIDDFLVYEDFIYILDSQSKKILVYDYSLDFCKVIWLDEPAHSFIIENNKIYLFSNFSSNELKNYYVIDLISGKVIHKFDSYLKKQKGVSYKQTTFSVYNDTVYTFKPFDFNIYRIHNKLIPKYHISINKKYSLPAFFEELSDVEREDYIQSNFSSFYDMPVMRINNLYVCDKFLSFTFIFKAGEYLFFKWNENDKIDYGILAPSKKFPLVSSDLIYLDESCYITKISPESIHLRKEKKLFYPPELEDIDIQDNPILYKLIIK